MYVGLHDNPSAAYAHYQNYSYIYVIHGVVSVHRSLPTGEKLLRIGPSIALPIRLN